MSQPISFGELDINLVASLEETRRVPAEETPFRMLVMGDFSGRTNRVSGKQAKSPTAFRSVKPIRVDRDSIDAVLNRLEVAIELPLLGDNAPSLGISFSELDDFHPDALYQRLEVFKAFKQTRQSLDSPSGLAAYIDQLRGAPLSEDSTEPEDDAVSQTTGGLLDQIIEQSQSTGQKPAAIPTKSKWGSFLNDIVKPHLVAKADPRQEEMVDAVDAAVSEVMRKILHHEDFQAVEAAWRGLSFLVSRLETDSRLQLYVLDVTQEELAADLFGSENLRRTALYKLLVEQAIETAGGQPWAVVAGKYTFEKTTEHISLLGRMAKVVGAAGISFIAGAGDRFLCARTLAETPDPDQWHPRKDQEADDNWQSLRQMAEAQNVGLCLPRFLLRLPYGKNTDPIDSFTFEEVVSPPAHADYLWGNPCLALLLLLGQSFSTEGWQKLPGSLLEIGSLPLHIYKEAGESHVQPCAETMLSQRAAENILDQGLMPLLSFLNRDMARLGRFQSIADPVARLLGPWS